MSKIQNQDFSLQELVSKIDKGEYHIPKFQRDFVWKSSDIESLGDSIIRGYPISSMLVMPINGTLTIGAGALRTSGSRISSSNAEYVLDGQQRITSIAKIFLGFDEQKEYYFDLLSMLVEKFPEDNIMQDSGICSKVKGKNNYNYSKISDTLCKSFGKSQTGDEKNTRQYNRFISGRSIIESRYGAVINKFLNGFSQKSEEEIDKYTDYLNGVMGGVGGYGIPITRISADSDLDLVIRVFEKVNSTGKPLNIFNLINAKTFKQSTNNTDEGLAEFLNQDIHNYCLTHDNTKAIENYFEYMPSHSEYKNLTRVIRIISILEMMNKGNYPHITKSHMFAKEGSFWFEMWNAYGEAILDTLLWFDKYSLVDLSNKIFLEYMIPIIILFPSLKNQALFLDAMKKYILYSQIKKISFSKTNLDIVMKFYEFAKEIDEHKNSLSKHAITLPINMELNMSASDVVGIPIGKSASYYATLYILYNESQRLGSVDFTNNKIAGIKNKEFDEHHIFPKAQTKHYPRNSLFNSVANMTLLNGASNRWEIKGKPFMEYMEELKALYTKEQFDDILKQNYLDPQLVWSRAEEETILQKRAEIIAEVLTNYFNTPRMIITA